MRRPGYAIALLVAALFLAGCGYYVSGRGGRMPGGVTRLAIPVFANETDKPDIEAALTEAFTSEMLNTVEVASDAEAVLTGVITAYTLTPVSFTRSDVNIEYRLTVALSLRITRGGKVLWHDENVVDYEDFTVDTSDVAATRDAERAALEKLAVDTARSVKEQMLSAF